MSLPRLTLFAVLPILACAPADSKPAAPEVVAPAQPAELTIHATDMAFAAPDTIAPGVTRIRLINDGPSEHQAILVRLDSGKTMADLQAAMSTPTPPPAWARIVGGDGGIRTGQENITFSDLTPGTYALLCFFQNGPTDPPHFALGMARELIVTGTRGEAPAPVADAEIRLVDYSFEMPTITAGARTLRLTNGGTEIHEIVVMRIPEGKTAQDVIASMAPGSTAIGESLGGDGALSPGESNWWQATFTPGDYVALCFVPAKDGKPHVMHGMVHEFTVTAS
ncbi:MAG TPA: hypothetical protein VFN22_12040 [Gemmatimonadales bacterium]|nr:hypothetical protein [Gemmatimonadales bacterium]